MTDDQIFICDIPPVTKPILCLTVDRPLSPEFRERIRLELAEFFRKSPAGPIVLQEGMRLSYVTPPADAASIGDQYWMG